MDSIPGSTAAEVSLRLFLLLMLVATETVHPFVRVIHLDEVWLYKNPVTESYFPVWVLWLMCVIVPPVVVSIFFTFRRDCEDVKQSVLCTSLIFLLNGVLTNILKITVGRPRPDFFHRCFPDGLPSDRDILTRECTGDSHSLIEGRKSFPSGHASFAFACLGFTSIYLAGKLHVFSHRGRGQSWRLVLTLAPLVGATLIAVSRTCDYHHHWQDVLVGSLLGFALVYLCYFQYYPPLTSGNSHKPLVSLTPHATSARQLHSQQHYSSRKNTANNLKNSDLDFPPV